MTAILLSSNPDMLRSELSQYKLTATVEAEYGSICVDGTVITLAHHGERSVNPAPCLRDNSSIALDAIGLSHCDLDTLGGVLSLLNSKPECEGFWELAAFVDVNGAHKLSLAGASPANVARLHAWWAWSDSNKCFAPRKANPTKENPVPVDPPCAEVSAWVEKAFHALSDIFGDDIDSLVKGEAFRLAGEALAEKSFIRLERTPRLGLVVIVRQSEKFTNHLYTQKGYPYSQGNSVREKFPCQDTICDVVISLTPKGILTLSLANPIEGINCCTVLQSLFGEKAGGHAGIAGGDRDVAYDWTDVQKVISSL
jgi:hypothetical protein